MPSEEWVRPAPHEFFAGKAYIVEFWASWCIAMYGSDAHFVPLQKKYKDSGLQPVGVVSS